jgi:hypothetical protein
VSVDVLQVQETLNDNSPVQAAVSFSDTASQVTAAYADRPAAAASFAVSSAAAEFLPGFSTAAASVPVFPATPVIMPGVYGSVPNYPAAGYDYLNGNKISQIVPGGVQNLEGTGVFLGGRYSMEEVIGFGGISHADSLVRSSERIRRQYNADDTQLDRAIQLTEAKNKGSSSGTFNNTKFFLQSIPHENVIATASKLGVSLGDSQSDVLNTLNMINRNDSKRTLIMLSKNLEEKIPDQIEMEENILNKANNLSQDLVNEEFVESDDILNLTLADIKKNRVFKKKVSVKKPVARRSARLKK